MANIILEPKETFQHTHDHPSLTRVVSGDVQLQMNGMSFDLQGGQEIFVPAFASHTLHNTGKIPAEVYCGHRVENGVPD